MSIPSKIDNQKNPSAKLDASPCENCESTMAFNSRFCSHCGQERLENESFSAFFDQFLKDYFTFDSKILRSLKPLMIRPGFLTDAYLDGHRIRYIAPLRLFIFTSIIFFLLLGLSPDPIVDLDIEDMRQAQLWNRFFTSLLPKLFILFLPFFALLVNLFFAKKKRFFIRPFLFSAHYHSFIFILGSLYWLSSKLFVKLGLIEVNYILALLILGYILIYLWLGLRKVYRLSNKQQTLRFIGLLTTYLIGLMAGATLLIWSLQS